MHKRTKETRITNLVQQQWLNLVKIGFVHMVKHNSDRLRDEGREVSACRRIHIRTFPESSISRCMHLRINPVVAIDI